jgi:hypothetical protein
MSDWDSLEDDAKAHSRKRGGCGIAILLTHVTEESGPEAANSLARVLLNHRLTNTSIHRALESRVEPDYLPSPFTLARHRSNRCSCPKEAS